MDAKGAKQQLNQAAKQKVFQGKINLDALVTNESNDLIVEYNIPSESVATGLERRNYIAANKKNSQSRFNRGVGVQLLRDYNNLPIAFTELVIKKLWLICLMIRTLRLYIQTGLIRRQPWKVCL